MRTERGTRVFQIKPARGPAFGVNGVGDCVNDRVNELRARKCLMVRRL